MTADSGVLDQVTLQFLHALKQDTNYMQVAAQHLFYYLVLIQLSISSLWMVLAGEPLQSFIYKLIQMAFSFGFFYAMISLGTTWLPEIINGFINIGQSGGVTSLDPDAILQQGISIANAILKGFYNWGLLSHPFISIVGAIICLGIIVLYALIAAELVLTLAKSYIVVSVNSLFFAFSGLKLTQPITYTFIQAIISIGLQLMTLYLLIGVGQTLGFNWAELTKTAAEQHELTPMLVIWAAAILYFMLIRHIPPYVAQLALFPFAAQHAGSSTIPVKSMIYGPMALSTWGYRHLSSNAHHHSSSRQQQDSTPKHKTSNRQQRATSKTPSDASSVPPIQSNTSQSKKKEG